tara:strand:- start:1705 stop:1890 length:186 start_codon:yes stop_codon:yes gene_type:complete
MSFKIISSKDWIKKGLPTNTMTIHVGSNNEWKHKKIDDLKKNKLKKDGEELKGKIADFDNK